MDEKESLEWLDLILEMSGTGRSIQKLLNRHRDEINLLEHNLYPAILKMERRDRKWERIRRSLTPAQKMALKKQNYVFLDTGQQRIIYGRMFETKIFMQRLLMFSKSRQKICFYPFYKKAIFVVALVFSKITGKVL